ncbi:MAG TPA: hypothetical protein VGF85_07760 [Opitutaceae bacterium]
MNRISAVALIVLSLVALFAVLSGFGHPPAPDEGAAAHCFQLSMVALVPAGLVFLATADGRRPGLTARLLAVPVSVVVFAFVALYLLERRS